MFKTILSLRPQWTLNYTLLWFRVYHLVTSPLFFLLLTLILRCFFLNVAECYSYNSTIFVIDRANENDETYFDSWLVHIDHLSLHLGHNPTAINVAILTGNPLVSPTVGEVYISSHTITSIEWCNLIIRHPEMVHSGFSCIIEYETDLGEGPRDPVLTVNEFLFSYCR